MPERRLCPDHLLVSIGSSQDRLLTGAQDSGEAIEIAGCRVRVLRRALVTAPGEPMQARFDLEKIAP